MLIELANFKPETMTRIRVVTSVLPLTLSSVVVVAAWLSRTTGAYDLWSFYPVFVMYGVVTVLDYLIGRDVVNTPTKAAGEKSALDSYFRWLPILCVPLHFSMLLFAAQFVSTAPLTWLGYTGWVLSVGIIGGTVAINVGHELIHKPTKLEQWAGGALLSMAAYGTFKVEHVMGHHAWVATDRDASSAKQGETIYGFVPRAIWRNTLNAFKLQAAQLQRKGFSAWSWRNELWWWSGLTISLIALFGAVFGAIAAWFFVGQALVAIANLEIINYVEHYGLRRDVDAAGRPVRVTPMHSWNSSYFLSNAYLFQLQRHSDHHATAGRRYQDLQHHEAAPQLPGGYGAMILLSLVPPLWRNVMDARLPR